MMVCLTSVVLYIDIREIEIKREAKYNKEKGICEFKIECAKSITLFPGVKK